MQPAPGQGILLASQQYAPVLCILLIVPFVECILRALVASSRHKSVCTHPDKMFGLWSSLDGKGRGIPEAD